MNDMLYDLDGIKTEIRCPEELRLLNIEGIDALLRTPHFYFQWHARKFLFLLEKT